MEVGLIIKVAGIGILVSVATQVLNKSGRDEQAMMVTLTGILVVLGIIVAELGSLIEQVAGIFGL
ncbi:MAG: stage III sporulation protein AC [Clostridia bacterium]|jgi:stage III sporulation protein AC|nr:stage III sporulation protein AC [Clostridia bacterium]